MEKLTTRTKGEIIQVAVMANDISYIKNEVTEINKKLASEYVSKAEFEPIKKIVYGLVGIILTGVIVAIIRLVVMPQ